MNDRNALLGYVDVLVTHSLFKDFLWTFIYAKISLVMMRYMLCF